MWKVVSVALVLGATGAVAQASSDTAGSRGPDNDANRMICENQTEIGSRLSRRRICRTRAEWDAHRAQSRDTVERVQYFKPCRLNDGSVC